ncbi:MAG: hypothetical protein K2L70_02215 [Clostridia bacterium]|nr:hypothetical protein [Clostridia bacterium]
MTKKKSLAVVVCIALVVITAISLCACGGVDAAWKSVGLTSSTLTLPQLNMSQMKSVRGNNQVAMFILWNDATENDFKSLAKECFTKIPANLDSLGNTMSSIDDMIYSDDEVMLFNGEYRISGDKYNCAVMFFIEEFEGNDAIDDLETVTYKKNQLLLVLKKQIVQIGNKHSWDIDSNDKTWFTQEELEYLGLDGLQAPQGKILGKIVSNDNGYSARMSIEIASDEVYDSFIQKLFNDYGMNLSREEEMVESYKNPEIYYFNQHFTMFSPRFKVEDKTFSANINLDDGHIVIEIFDVE